MRYASLLAAAEGESGGNPAPILLPEFYDILWSAVAFVVIVVLFVWKILPRLNAALDERKNVIEGGIARAENAQAEAAAALEEYNAQLAEARAEAGRIREQARTDGAAIIAEAKEQAQVEATRVTQSAQAQIEAERAAALVSLRAEVGSLALDLASGVVGEALADDAKSTALVDRFLADLESAEKAKAGK